MKTCDLILARKPLRSSPFISPLACAAVGAWLCLVPRAHAQLPNAWQITDATNAPGSLLSYSTNLPAPLQVAATNAGFDFSVDARFVTDYSTGAPTLYMAYGLGTRRCLIYWGLNSNGDLTAQLDAGGTTFVLTTNGTGSAFYHTNEIIYNPGNGTASYLFDGQVITNNWPPSAYSWTSGQIAWGAGSSAGEAEMNFHSISFIVTNGVVAGYDAGTQPTNAPDPATGGWSLSPSPPPAGTGTNAVSPDRGPDVVTALADNGYGSLRQTIATARSGDTITFFTNGVIKLTGGELLITKDLTIAGPGPVNLAIDAGGNSRVLEITNANATLDSLTLTNGNTPQFGGGIYVNTGVTLTVSNCTLSGNYAGEEGGGILNIGTLTLKNSTLTGNVAASSGGGGIENFGGTNTLDNCTLSSNSGVLGGSIDNESGGRLTLNSSTVSNNFARYGGGGIYNNNDATLTVNNSSLTGNFTTNNDGGGIYNNNNATLTVNGSTLSGNSASEGGGIGNSQAAITVTNCILSGNSAGLGGGILNYDGAATINGSTLSSNSVTSSYGGAIYNDLDGTLAINDSTLSGNYAGLGGGAIYDYEATNTLNDSTLSGNSTGLGGYGGGLDNVSINSTGSCTVSDCTLTGNSAPNGLGGGIYNDTQLTMNNSTLFGNSVTTGYGGGLYNDLTNTLNNCTLNNCTLSGNSAGLGGGINNDGIMSFTNTIVAGNTATNYANMTPSSFSGANNLTNGIPLLAPLGNYGGLTETMPPLAGSPAIDAGNDSVTSFLTTDQRGYPRKSGAHVDIGAVEAQYAPANNPPQLMNAVSSHVGGSNSFQFTFTNVANADFTALTTTNLALPLADWIPIGNAAQNPPGQYQFTDVSGTNYPQRFYSIVSP